MNCREFPPLISAQLDGYAGEHEQAELQEHLSNCAACRRYAAELRCLRAELRAWKPVAPSAESSGEIVAALQREARLQARTERRRADQLAVWRMRLFSQSVGAVVSLTLFSLLTMAVFRPSYRALALARVAVEEAGGTEFSDEGLQLRIIIPPPPPPVFNPSGELLGFSQTLLEGDEFIAAVKVRRDGRASVEMVEPPRDPSMVMRLSHALFRQASFHPAGRSRPGGSDAVLMFSKVKIPG